MAAKRTTHRSTAGKKLYAVRDKKGKFEDVQTYERAHGQDVKRKAKAEKRAKVSVKMMAAGAAFLEDYHAYAYLSEGSARKLCAGIYVAMAKEAA